VLLQAVRGIEASGLTFVNRLDLPHRILAGIREASGHVLPPAAGIRQDQEIELRVLDDGALEELIACHATRSESARLLVAPLWDLDRTGYLVAVLAEEQAKVANKINELEAFCQARVPRNKHRKEAEELIPPLKLELQQIEERLGRAAAEHEDSRKRLVEAGSQGAEWLRLWDRVKWRNHRGRKRKVVPFGGKTCPACSMLMSSSLAQDLEDPRVASLCPHCQVLIATGGEGELSDG
jgi:hypothetical protein